jgi:hypothetical protein
MPITQTVSVHSCVFLLRKITLKAYVILCSHAFCSHLLGNHGHNPCFCWIEGWQTSHGYYPEMDTALGAPFGPYQIQNGLYVRDFTNLRVVVNMTARTGQLLPRS